MNRRRNPRYTAKNIRSNVAYEINRFTPSGNRVFIGEINDNTTHNGAGRYIYHLPDKGTITVYAKDKPEAIEKIIGELK